MASDWTPPKGFTLTVIPGHVMDARGMAAAGSDPRRGIMADGATNVLWFNEAEPFVYEENNGRGPMASQEARDAAAAGKPLAGWNANAIEKPIEGGWVPPQYVLTKDDDPTPVTEPASAVARELTPAEQVERLEASIKAAQAQIADIKKGGAS